MKATKQLVTLAAVMFGAGAAWGQEAEFKKPLKAAPKAEKSTQSSAQSTTVMRSSDGDNEVEVKIQDGKHSATVNGKKVSGDRIVVGKESIRVLCEEGETIAEFPVISGDGQTLSFAQPMEGQKAPKAVQIEPGMGAFGMTEPPKVMIGITMAEPSDELLKNYDIKAGQVILVERVIEGLPADKAGLKVNDIITQIDGKKPVNQETLREVLRGKEPGDSVKFTVLRKGGDQTVRVTVDKFDPDKLGVTSGQTWVPGMGGDEGMKEAEKAMREAMKQHSGQGSWSFRMPEGGEGRAFVMGRGGETDERVAELDKRMAELDKKLEQIDDRIAKLQELIEKLAKRDR